MIKLSQTRNMQSDAAIHVLQTYIHVYIPNLHSQCQTYQKLYVIVLDFTIFAYDMIKTL